MFSTQRQRLSNSSLWEDYVRGDREAFGALYSRFHKSLTAFCMGRLKSIELAENAASDTLVKLLSHKEPGTIENFESWLFAVAKNECNTIWTTTERRKELLKENLEVTERQPAEIDVFFSAEGMEKIIRGNLDDRDYRIWQLYHEGYDNSEVASMMNLNEKTVANRKSAARMKLKEILRNHETDGT